MNQFVQSLNIFWMDFISKFNIINQTNVKKKLKLQRQSAAPHLTVHTLFSASMSSTKPSMQSTTQTVSSPSSDETSDCDKRFKMDLDNQRQLVDQIEQILRTETRTLYMMLTDLKNLNLTF